MSSRNLIEKALLDGITEESIDGLLLGTAKKKAPELLEAMDGIFTPIQKQLVRAILDHIDDTTRRISDMDDIIESEMREYEQAIAALDEIPGIGVETAQTILAEIGLNMDRFPTAAHLASWAGLSPGNNESAGKRKSGKTCKSNKTLKTTMVQCATAAVRTKNTFFRAQYDRLTVRRGANRAKVAVAHSMIIAIWHMLKFHEPYKDLGGDYYNQFNTEKKINSYLKKLSALGWLPPVPTEA